MERGTMEMEAMLDMLQTARDEAGVVGITQKSKEEQGRILEMLMQRFDAAQDVQTVIDSKWGFEEKAKEEK